MNGTRAHKAWKFINNKKYILSLFEVMRHVCMLVHVCMIEELHCGMTLKIYANENERKGVNQVSTSECKVKWVDGAVV